MGPVKKLKLTVQMTEESFNEGPDKLTENFYKIANHEELYKIGQGLFEQIQKGVKNFAFTSTGYKNSQQKAILGLACFFDQKFNYKIAVISDQLSPGLFSDLVESSSLNNHAIEKEQDVVSYKSFHHHFDFIDYSELIKFHENQLYAKTFDSTITSILDKYDIVLWDIPDMEKIKQDSDFHFRVSHFYESLTVIVSQDTSPGNEVSAVKSFFSKHNIHLKGIVFDTSDLKEQPKRRKVLGIF